MRAGELVEESRLAHARLTNDGDHLTAPRASLVQRLAELIYLGVTADERVELSRGERPEAGMYRSDAKDLIHLHRCAHALNRHRTELLGRHVGFGKPESIRRHQHRARG